VLVSLHTPANLAPAPPTPVTFDAARALDAAESLRDISVRAPGTSGGAQAAQTVQTLLEQTGAHVMVDRFRVSGTRGELQNLVVEAPGDTREAVVVLAPRDALADGTGDVASGTGVLVELTRGLTGLQRTRTLVLASVDGATLGEAGARELLKRLRTRLDLFAVIALAGVGDRTGPLELRDRGSGRIRTQAGLTRALVRDLEVSAGAPPLAHESAGSQVLDLVAPPLPDGDQAPFVDAGVPAVRVGVDVDSRPGTPLAQRRLAGVGNAVLGLLLALDAGPEPDGPRGPYLLLGDRVAAPFVLALAAGSLLVAPGLEALVLLARVRRERLSLTPALAATLRAALPLGGALVGLWLAAAAGQVPRNPYSAPYDGSGVKAGAILLIVIGAATGVAAIATLPEAPAPARDPVARAAAARAACLLVGVPAGLLALVGAPLAAVPALFALHGVALLERVTRGGAPARIAVVWLPPLATWVAVAALQSLGPGDLARLVADGRLPATTLLGSGAILAACLVLTVSVLRR
jgi:Peptidase family M28